MNTMLTTLVYRKTLRVSGIDQGSANTLLNIDPSRVKKKKKFKKIKKIKKI